MRNLKISLLVFILTIAVSAQDFWQKTKGPYGGTISTIKSNSSDSILAGTPNGIFLSSDLGENWHSYDENLNYKSVKLIENYLDEYLIILGHYALVKTTASSYDTIYFAYNDPPYTLAVNNSGKIFLGTAYNIFSSTDLGENWISLEDSNMSINYSNNILIKNDTIIFYSEGNQIHRSYDEGQSWIKINELFQNVPINTIYLDPKNNLYAANDMSKIFKSTDDGNSWENIDNNYVSSGISSIIKDSVNLYVGTSWGIYKTTNDGNSWYNYSNGLISKQVSCLSICGGKITAGTYGGGVYVLNENTNEWEPKMIGIQATRINDIIINSENNVLAGTDGMGIHRALNNDPLTWEIKNNGLSDLYVKSLAISKHINTYDHIYIAMSYGAFKTTNLGDDWVSINLPCYNGANGISVNNSGFIFIWSYCGMFKTTDDGISWDLMNEFFWNPVRNIEAEPLQSNVYVSDEYDFYRTTDNGESWTRFPFTGGSAHRIGINSKGYVYVLGDYGELLRSTNYGNSFQNINNGLPTEYGFMKAIAFNSEDDVYLATGNGLYVSIDDGNSWYLLDESDISKHINVLAFNNEDRLYAGTTVSGVFRSLELLTNLNENFFNTKSYFLSQNYPNPFNPTTKIKYRVPDFSLITLKVYDILGREVATLVNEEKPAGEYEVEFGGANLPSGVYFYQLKAGNFVETKQMVLIK